MRKIRAALMALLGGASLLSAAGCGTQFFNPYFDRPNPWRTSSDVERLQDKKEEDWQLELQRPWDYPQTAGIAFALPDLEGWRDTVLVNADTPVLLRMRDQSVQKVAWLESLAQSMAPINEDSKIQIYELLWQIRGEKSRLQMIEERLGAAGR